MRAKAACSGCRDGEELEFSIAMAFQPIVDLETGLPFAYEALVRGVDGQGAGWVLSQISEATRYAFDQRCRVTAIEAAVAAGILDTGAKLSINFLPNAVYSPKACIQLTLATSARTGFPTNRLLFEFTENERITDPAHVTSIIEAYREMGFGVALDDFGAGYSGLGLLARFQPDIVKLDMELIRDLDSSLPRRMIVSGVMRMCETMGLTVIAEGIETAGEMDALRSLGVRLMQGYFFAKPAFMALPAISVPALPALAAAA